VGVLIPASIIVVFEGSLNQMRTGFACIFTIVECVYQTCKYKGIGLRSWVSESCNILKHEFLRNFVSLLFQLAGSALFIFRNVPDVLASTLSAHTHAKRVFAILIIPAVPLPICPPRLLTKSLSAVARLFCTAQFLAYAVPQVGALLWLPLKLTDA